MRALQVGGIDSPKVITKRRAKNAVVDQTGRLIQEMMLLDHVGCFKKGASEHQLPMKRDTFSLELQCIERGRIVDQPELSLRSKTFDELLVMLIGLREARNEGDVIDSDSDRKSVV